VVKKPIFPGLATMKDGREASSEYHSAEEGFVEHEDHDQAMGDGQDDAQPEVEERVVSAAANGGETA